MLIQYYWFFDLLSFMLKTDLEMRLLREWWIGWLCSLHFPPKHHHSPLYWLGSHDWITDGERERERWMDIFALRKMRAVAEERGQKKKQGEEKRYLVVRRGGGGVFWWADGTGRGGVMKERTRWWCRWIAEWSHFHLTFIVIADCYEHIKPLSAQCTAPKITST